MIIRPRYIWPPWDPPLVPDEELDPLTREKGIGPPYSPVDSDSCALFQTIYLGSELTLEQAKKAFYRVWYSRWRWAVSDCPKCRR